MGENRLLRSFSHLFLFYIILSFFLLYKINVCQCAQADYYPKQNSLNQRLYSNCFQYINRKRSTDEKHGNRQSFTGNTVNSRSQLWYSIQQISVYYQCQHEEEDKPWNTYLLSFALENKGSSKSHRDNPKRTGQFNSGCHFQPAAAPCRGKRRGRLRRHHVRLLPVHCRVCGLRLRQPLDR